MSIQHLLTMTTNAKTKLFALLATVFGDNTTFTLQQVYQVAEGAMSYYYPNNTTIQATIRRNLEDLRDDGFLNFVDNQGTYSWV